MDNNKQPKKPRKSRKRSNDSAPLPTPAPQQTIPVSIVPLTPEENKEFLDQINKYLQKKEPAKPKNTTNEFKVLQDNINEYLESYIAFGYTFDGQRVLIQQCSTPRDRDAILEFLKSVFVMNASREENSHFDDLDE